jgi:hypothetical protein
VFLGDPLRRLIIEGEELMTPTERALLMAIADFLLSGPCVRAPNLSNALKALEEEDRAAAKAAHEKFGNPSDAPIPRPSKEPTP